MQFIKADDRCYIQDVIFLSWHRAGQCFGDISHKQGTHIGLSWERETDTKTERQTGRQTGETDTERDRERTETERQREIEEMQNSAVEAFHLWFIVLQ